MIDPPPPPAVPAGSDDQQYPVRLPAGPIREQHKQADGTETYALIQGNLYGLPTAARTYTKERHRLILSELPKRTGWTASKLLREPCCYHLNTGHRHHTASTDSTAVDLLHVHGRTFSVSTVWGHFPVLLPY